MAENPIKPSSKRIIDAFRTITEFQTRIPRVMSALRTLPNTQPISASLDTFVRRLDSYIDSEPSESFRGQVMAPLQQASPVRRRAFEEMPYIHPPSPSRMPRQSPEHLALPVTTVLPGEEHVIHFRGGKGRKGTYRKRKQSRRRR